MSSFPSSSSDDYAAQSDAETLQKADEIKGDKGRHQAALDHIASKTQQGASMVARHARRSLQKKVKGHMNKVFGGNKGSPMSKPSPFQAALGEKDMGGMSGEEA